MKKSVTRFLLFIMTLSFIYCNNVFANEVSIGARVEIYNDKYISVLKIGDSIKLSLNYIEVSENDIASVMWESSNPSVATVDQNGNVKALKEGKAIIKVLARESGPCDDLPPGMSCTQEMPAYYEDEYDIDVIEKEEIITIGDRIMITSVGNKNTIKVNDTLKLSVEFIEMSRQKISWESSNPTVATVDSNGNVKGKSAGKTVIKAYTNDRRYTDEYVIYVNNKEEPSVTIGARIIIKTDVGASSLVCGEKLQFLVDFIELSEEKVIWEVSDEAIATIDSNGLLTSKNVGEVVVRAYTQNRVYKDEFVLLITDDLVGIYDNQEIKIVSDGNRDTIKVGEKIQLKVDSEEAAGIRWESSDEAVATINSDGEVIAKKDGVVTIKAITSDGEVVEYSLKVEATDEVESKNNTMFIIIGGIVLITCLVIGFIVFKNKDKIFKKVAK